MTSHMRPNEQAAFSEIENAQARDEKLRKLGKTGSIIPAGGIAAKIAPFFSHYLPTDLAVKGISKVSPHLGEFLKKGMEQGLNVKDGMDFLAKSFGMTSEEEQKQESTQAEQTPQPKPNEEQKKEKQNIISQYDPELHIYISEALKKGEDILNVGTRALKHERFKKAIDKLTKDHGKSWYKILEEVYGVGGYGLPPKNQQQASQQPQQSQSKIAPKLGDTFIDRFGKRAKITQIDNKNFEYTTENGGKKSGPLSSLEFEMSGNQQENAQPNGDDELLSRFQKVLKM